MYLYVYKKNEIRRSNIIYLHKSRHYSLLPDIMRCEIRDIIFYIHKKMEHECQVEHENGVRNKLKALTRDYVSSSKNLRKKKQGANINPQDLSERCVCFFLYLFPNSFLAVVTALHSSRYEERQNEKYKSTYFFYFSQNCWRRFTVKVSRVYRRSTQEEMKKNKKINLFLHPPFLTMINITQQRPERVTKEQGLPHRSISSVVIYDEILSLKKRPMKLHKTKSISDTCQSLKGGVSIEIKVLQTRKITTNKDDLHVHQNDIGKRQDAGNRKE